MRYLTTLVLLCALAGCQTPMQTGSQCVVPSGYLAGESLYSWRNGQAIDVVDGTGYVSPIIEKSLVGSVEKELQGKGFSAQPGADLEFALTLRTRRELVSFDSQDPICGPEHDCWERIDMGSQTRMDVRTIGFLAADAYFEGEPIWRGWVETTLYPKDRDGAAEVIERAVVELFETFPP